MTSHSSIPQLLGSRPPGQVTHQARVHEINLRCLSEALVNIWPEWLDDSNDVGCLEYRQPGLDRLVIHADGTTDVGCVEELTRPCGAGYHEAVELRLVFHGQQIADIALEVCSYVARIEGVPVN